ncbi:M24 family metallopeptidase [Aquirufa regiilacus]|uniref:Xaa-Pro peptidase family protein n=1 Tax=Aquirufa regiilacus TaxID=3024868 RepID=A0ABU3TRJ1_9BACT|nr:MULTISPECIES: Xaa-Pro peptidase family protein [unclassified Aquirufa]MDT8888162.1 Xaa-Pro peptidase family protein [Aquirufa sp. LEPPI-3A]MDU0808496.1 Xaa-Pro peptidase family protein [Aquirufa sp. LEOWEIH-7C]
MIQRRDFIKSSIGISALMGNANLYTQAPSEASPISNEERMQRIGKAQELLQKNNMVALILDAGTTMQYFTGLSWYPSERSMLVIIPTKGELTYICPYFEEDRLLELIKIGKQVRTWHEDENPFELCIKTIKDFGFGSGQIGIEEQTRFFISNGLQKAGQQFQLVSGDPVSVTCRLIKSPAEIALMQKANDITTLAIQAGIAALTEGCTPRQISQKIAQKHTELGAQHGFASVTFGVATSFPHGSSRKQILQKGDVVMLDCGCQVDGYESDITRTVVFGEPTQKQIDIWNLEKRAQQAGFEAAVLGAPCENVDLAARGLLVKAGFGPEYKLPGLPHRTGHGIGMDGHEWGNMVKGNKLPLQVGMCFSIEPTIAIPGEFGVRLEDCVYMTEQGPKWFSQPSPSISQAFT